MLSEAPIDTTNSSRMGISFNLTWRDTHRTRMSCHPMAMRASAVVTPAMIQRQLRGNGL